MNEQGARLRAQEFAEEDEIRRAYKKLALAHHPDKNVGNEEAASEEFKKIECIVSAPMPRRGGQQRERGRPGRHLRAGPHGLLRTHVRLPQCT